MRYILPITLFALAACAQAGPTGGNGQNLGRADLPPMHTGVNVLALDPVWIGEAPRFTDKDLVKISSAGFDTIRVNLPPFDMLLGPDHTIWPGKLAVLDHVVNAAIAQNLTVVMDYHDRDSRCSAKYALCEPKLLALWQQLATHFKGTSNRLVFELLNEPHEPLTDQEWNAAMGRLIAAIRKRSATRPIMVTPVNYSALEKLDVMVLPDDPNLIVDVHYYTPQDFTIQFNKPARYKIWGTPDDRAQLSADFDRIKAWSEQHGRPIFVGEFGVWDDVPIQYRAVYLKAVVEAAEQRKIPWAYWQYQVDFRATDPRTGDWIPEIFYALTRRH